MTLPGVGVAAVRALAAVDAVSEGIALKQQFHESVDKFAMLLTYSNLSNAKSAGDGGGEDGIGTSSDCALQLVLNEGEGLAKQISTLLLMTASAQRALCDLRLTGRTTTTSTTAGTGTSTTTATTTSKKSAAAAAAHTRAKKTTNMTKSVLPTVSDSWFAIDVILRTLHRPLSALASTSFAAVHVLETLVSTLPWVVDTGDDGGDDDEQSLCASRFTQCDGIHILMAYLKGVIAREFVSATTTTTTTTMSSNNTSLSCTSQNVVGVLRVLVRLSLLSRTNASSGSDWFATTMTTTNAEHASVLWDVLETLDHTVGSLRSEIAHLACYLLQHLVTSPLSCSSASSSSVVMSPMANEKAKHVLRQLSERQMVLYHHHHGTALSIRICALWSWVLDNDTNPTATQTTLLCNFAASVAHELLILASSSSSFSSSELPAEEWSRDHNNNNDNNDSKNTFSALQLGWQTLMYLMQQVASLVSSACVANKSDKGGGGGKTSRAPASLMQLKHALRTANAYLRLLAAAAPVVVPAHHKNHSHEMKKKKKKKCGAEVKDGKKKKKEKEKKQEAEAEEEEDDGDDSNPSKTLVSLSHLSRIALQTTMMLKTLMECDGPHLLFEHDWNCLLNGVEFRRLLLGVLVSDCNFMATLFYSALMQPLTVALLQTQPRAPVHKGRASDDDDKLCALITQWFAESQDFYFTNWQDQVSKAAVLARAHGLSNVDASGGASSAALPFRAPGTATTTTTTTTTTNIGRTATGTGTGTSTVASKAKTTAATTTRAATSIPICEAEADVRGMSIWEDEWNESQILPQPVNLRNIPRGEYTPHLFTELLPVLWSPHFSPMRAFEKMNDGGRRWGRETLHWYEWLLVVLTHLQRAQVELYRYKRHRHQASPAPTATAPTTTATSAPATKATSSSSSSSCLGATASSAGAGGVFSPAEAAMALWSSFLMQRVYGVMEERGKSVQAWHKTATTTTGKEDGKERREEEGVVAMSKHLPMIDQFAIAHSFTHWWSGMGSVSAFKDRLNTFYIVDCQRHKVVANGLLQLA